jgi:outer membrane protein OmpA-like peptidoglycan-associated protein
MVSYGSKRPAAPNDTPENRQYNRKVEVKAIVVEGLNHRYGELRRKSFGAYGRVPATGRSEPFIREPGPMLFFATNQAVLRPESMTVLDNLSRIFQHNPGIGIGLSLEGHAEPREAPRGRPGREQYLVALAQRRAQAAYDYLRKKGVPKSQLITRSYGGKRLAAPNDTPENRQLNRRVDCKGVRIETIESQLKARKSHLQTGTSVSGKKPATGAPHPKPAPTHTEQ